MLAEAAVPGLAQGATAEIELRNIGFVPGHIVWVGEGKFGVAFDRPIDPHAVRRQVVQKMDVPAYIAMSGAGRRSSFAIFASRSAWRDFRAERCELLIGHSPFRLGWQLRVKHDSPRLSRPDGRVSARWSPLRTGRDRGREAA